MTMRLPSCSAIAIVLTFCSIKSQADEQPETVIEHASGLEFESPVAERLVIRRVAPDSPAAAANLSAGDVVLGIDKYHFVTANDAHAYLDCQGPCPVRFTILRDGAEHKFVYVSSDPVPGACGNLPGDRQVAGIGIRVAGRQPVVIVAVYGGSPADKAGILPGDELVAVDDVAYPDVAAVSAAIAQHPEGEQFHLTIRRDGADQTIALTPGPWALDEPVHVLPGWEGWHRHGCHADRAGLAARDTFAIELDGLREEIRKLRQELSETNSRLAARPAGLSTE